MSSARLTRVFCTLLAACALSFGVAPAALAEFDDQYPETPGDGQPVDVCEPVDPSDPYYCVPGDWDGDGVIDEPTAPTGPTGPVATIGRDGRRARPAKGTPRIVRRAINAANRLTRKRYKWGGGHARFNDSGYDCSGAVSYVLRAIGRLDGSAVSGSLKKWGRPAEGKWITVYANKGHVFMVIAGLRFDTSGYGERGPRWRTEPRSYSRFAVRHPGGL